MTAATDEWLRLKSARIVWMIGVVKSRKRVQSSRPASRPGSLTIDRLSALLERFRVHASMFHTGALCGTTVFEAQPGRAFLHVLRRGEMEVRHRKGATPMDRFRITEPTVLLYPRPLRHTFINPPRDGSDLTCATLDFAGGEHNPIVQALPPILRVPLSEVDGLRPTLDLLFDEADRARCGSRLLADRLFEVVLIQLLRWIIDHPEQAGVSGGLITGLSHPRLARALVAVHQSPSDNWSLEKMATVAGMSRSAFAETFKKLTGNTPAAYLTGWRMSLAASMMRSGQPVKLIAAELGFSSGSALAKAFKQRLGTSPREWLMADQHAGQQ
jgi:AraC-like DNA-binding protein